MRFEYRILFLLFIVIVSGFTFMNFIGILYIRDVLREEIRTQAHLYSKLILYNRAEKLPPHVKVSETPLPPQGYGFILYTGKHYVFVSDDYVRSRLYGYALSLFLWEAGLVVMLMSLFYLTLVRSIRTERDLTDLLNVMLLSLTHRLGNFLASQKINAELLEDSPPVRRLKRSLQDLDRSYHRTFSLLETLQKERNVREEKLDLEKMVRDAISSHRDTDRSLRLDAPAAKLWLKANPVYVELLISLLVENALKYSRSRVHVKLCRSRSGKPILLIRNDVSGKEGGTGIGLQIVRFIAERIGADLKIRIRSNFTVLVVFR